MTTTMQVKRVYLKTEHGYIFHVKLYNEDDYTYFGCKTWRALCKTYAFEPDMVITFDILPEDDIDHYVSFSTIFMSLILFIQK